MNGGGLSSIMPPANVPHGFIFWTLGVPMTAAGVYILLGAIVAPERVRFTMETGTTTTSLVTGALAVMILTIGIGALLSRRWPEDEAEKRRWAGAAATVLGLAILVISLADPHESTFPSGRWAAVVAGLTTVCAGILAMVARARPSPPRSRAMSSLAGSLFALFALLFLGLGASQPGRGGGESFFLFFSFETPSWVDRTALVAAGLAFAALAAATWKQALRGSDPPP